jgi:AcrR family transcriptional regulator
LKKLGLTLDGLLTFYYIAINALPNHINYDNLIIVDEFIKFKPHLENSGGVTKMSNNDASSTLGSSTRRDRRKQETTLKLLCAAMHLMADRGPTGPTINEITNAADVGFGSFYNHFSSREDLYDALVKHVFDEFGCAIDQVSTNFNDPAEIVSASIRYTLLRARHDSLWGRLLLREGFNENAYTRGLGPFMVRDIRRGQLEGRFVIGDLLAALILTSGSVLAAIAADIQLAGPDSLTAKMVLAGGSSVDDLPERTAQMVLQALGVPKEEAIDIAHKVLPFFELPDSSFEQLDGKRT